MVAVVEGRGVSASLGGERDVLRAPARTLGVRGEFDPAAVVVAGIAVARINGFDRVAAADLQQRAAA